MPIRFGELFVGSRNRREGVYEGKRSGKHHRINKEWRDEYSLPHPFGLQVKALNRKQRKQLKLSEGE